MGDHHPHGTTASPDFHSVLGVAKGASIRDICKAYKSLVMKWHPDKHSSSNKSAAEAKFKSINEAYEALKDNQKDVGRSMYCANGSSHGGARTRGDDPTMPKASYRQQSVDNHFSSTPSSLPKSTSRKINTSSAPATSTLPKSTSQKNTTPIMFSYSTVRKKPPPIEKKLECTLEELCHGCVKKIKITRDVISNAGILVQEEELLKIKVKPGWKKGTKITFEGMGDERPGTLPADIIFLIDEKRHPLFKRDGDDLVLAVEIPLVKALTGCTLSVPLLGGEKMGLSLDDIIYPGYEKIIRGQGMTNPREQGMRGDLRIKFRIIFPTKLSQEQRSNILTLLQDSS